VFYSYATVCTWLKMMWQGKGFSSKKPSVYLSQTVWV